MLEHCLARGLGDPCGSLVRAHVSLVSVELFEGSIRVSSLDGTTTLKPGDVHRSEEAPVATPLPTPTAVPADEPSSEHHGPRREGDPLDVNPDTKLNDPFGK